MADGFEPGRVGPVLPVARLHGPHVVIAQMKRSLVYGTVVAVTWLVDSVVAVIVRVFADCVVAVIARVSLTASSGDRARFADCVVAVIVRISANCVAAEVVTLRGRARLLSTVRAVSPIRVGSSRCGRSWSGCGSQRTPPSTFGPSRPIACVDVRRTRFTSPRR
jgi:hypothetical protein